MRSREWTRHGLGAVLCVSLSACGGGTDQAPLPTQQGPGTPTSPGLPTPSAVSAGFLHVRTNSGVTTYSIDGQTGRLRQTGEQDLGRGVDALSGEPRGRFVFAASNPQVRRPYRGGGPQPSIVTLAADPRDGALAAVSEEWHPASNVCNYGADTMWDRVTADSGRVHGVWVTRCMASSVTEVELVTHTVAADGRLGPATFGYLSERQWDGVVDARSARVYSGPDYFRPTHALRAFTIEAGGYLRREGTSDRCLDVPIAVASPLVGARGLVFAAGPGGLVCAWEGAGLTPHANLGLAAKRGEAFVPDDASLPARIVFESDRGDLQLVEMTPGGVFSLMDTFEGVGETTRMLFHPSGRFLFVQAATSLQVFSISPEGRLARVESLAGAGGPMAVTTPHSEPVSVTDWSGSPLVPERVEQGTLR